MDTTKLNELRAVYANNINKGQKTKIILYNIMLALLSVVCAFALYFVNYFVNGLGGKLWTTLFAVAAVVLFVLSYGIIKKFPFITTKNYFVWCALCGVVFAGIAWLVCVILLIVSDVFTGKATVFMYTSVKDWMVFPLCYSLAVLGLIIVSIICIKSCKKCCVSGFGLASKSNYIIEKITKDHVDSVRREKPGANLGEYDVHYDNYYVNYEYRFYRHYCSICGGVVYEKMRKVKSGKKYLSKLEVFSEADIAANQKRIEASKEYFAKKEAKILSKLNKLFEKEEQAKAKKKAEEVKPVEATPQETKSEETK